MYMYMYLSPLGGVCIYMYMYMYLSPLGGVCIYMYMYLPCGLSPLGGVCVVIDEVLTTVRIASLFPSRRNLENQIYS